MGASLNYNNLKIEGYGNDNSIALSLGGLAYILGNLRLGFFIDNITRSSYGNEKGQIPTTFDLGFSYDLISSLTFNAAIQKEIEQNVSIRFGIDYEIIRYINLRLGAMNEPSSFSAGIGLKFTKNHIDVLYRTNFSESFIDHLGSEIFLSMNLKL